MASNNSYLVRNVIGMTAQAINMVATNMNVNAQLGGSITLDDVNIKGTMNCKLQSSIYNQFDDELLNSKNSKCQADTYGAVYGPTYGDNLGTVNCRGAFIGTETTGFIGSTFNSKIDSVSQSQLLMNTLVADQTVSSGLTSEDAMNNAKNNTAIPMNMVYFEPSLENFSVSSYNTTGPKDAQETHDAYFGNLWAITRTGQDDTSTLKANTLYQQTSSITRLNITKPSGLFNVVGNLSLNGPSYVFTNAVVENAFFSGIATYAFNQKGNVLVNDSQLLFSNVFLGNLSQTNVSSTNANLTGNFQFNSNIIYPSSANPQTISINGNIYNTGSNNEVQWSTVSPAIPQIGNANIDFPKAISSVQRFNNINANIVYFNSNIMNNSNTYYNTLTPPQYGTFIENIYNNMAIYNDQTNSLNSDNFIYINPTNANSKLENGNIPNYNAQFPVSSGAFAVGNIISNSTPINPSINNYVFPQSINSGTANLYNNMDTWVKYLKWTDPNNQSYTPWPYTFSNYVITNQFTLNGNDDTNKSNNYYGYSQGNIKNKAWRILDDIVNPLPQYTINGTLMWAFQSGVFSSNTSNAYDPDMNPGLNNGEATFMLFSGINGVDYPMTASAHKFTATAIASVNGFEKYFDLLTFAYVDYTDSLITNTYGGSLNSFKQDVIGTLKPGQTFIYTNTYTVDTSSKQFTVQYCSPQETSSETTDMSTLKSFNYNLPLIVSGSKRMIILFYMKDNVDTNLNDVAMITNIAISAQNYNYTNYLQPNLFYGWNLKSSSTINTNININASLLPIPSTNVYLSTGTDTLTLYDNNATYLLMGPIKAVDFNKQYFYQQYLYCEALFGSSAGTWSGEFRVYRVESATIIPQNNLVSNVLLTSPSTQNSFTISLNNDNTNTWININTSTNNNLFVYNTLSNTNYVYYVIRFINYSNTSCALRNLKIIQQPLPNYSIPSFNITVNESTKKVSAQVNNNYFNPFTLQYNYSLFGTQSVSGNSISISGGIQNRPNLVFYANLITANNNISGSVSIYGEEIISNLIVSGTKTGGNPNDFNAGGSILINGSVNFWDKDFYKYAWHANLNNATVEQLPPITPTLIDNSPFSGLSSKLILQCGTASDYNSTTNTYSLTPLFDNQLSIMTWKFVPEKQTKNPLLSRDFTIRFKYQLYSELRGDFFYFQYSPDLGRTYYNLIKQSGDIKSVKSVALFTNSLWKQAEFYLPGGNTTEYLFRWIYEKDLGVSNGFDVVYLGDIGVNYTGPVLVDNNGYTTNYSNEFVGNITTGGSSTSSIQPYLLPFPIGNPDAGSGFVLYNINYGSNSMSSYNWGSARSNSNMYTLVNTYYRRDINPNDYTYPSQSDIQFFKMLGNNGNNGQYTDKVWRLYDINTLKSVLGYPINVPGGSSWLDVNASSGFYNGTDMALMSSTQNNQSPYDDNGLTNGEATYLTLGPFNSTISNGDYSDLTTKPHTFRFKYLPDTENGYDLTGVITYDYNPNDGDAETIRSTLVKILTFNQSFHLTQYNLDQWFNSNGLINRSNIRYYPDQSGIYNSSTPVNGWINFSADIPAVPQGKNRIYVIYFAKDWYSTGSYNDVVLLHDIQFTFQTPSSVILDNSGYLHGNTSGSFKIVSVNGNSIVIDIPGFGNKTISLS